MGVPRAVAGAVGEGVRILIVGSWRWPIYEEAFARGLRGSGVEVVGFSTMPFFAHRFGRLQCALPLPSLSLLRLNRAIVAEAEEQRPDWVLFWRPTHILPTTVRKLNALAVRTASYNNDDPFGPKTHRNVPWHHHFLWYWYLKCLPVLDRNFFFRSVNCEESVKYGARQADVLMPYFRPWQDRPVELTTAERTRFEADVVFAGHYEPDGREIGIKALVAAGLKVKIWGGHYWDRAVLGDFYHSLAPIVPAEGDDYARALCGAKVCLTFLSKLNRDTYTRRCFEIPACGRVMLAERTADLTRLFKEDEEACYFSSTLELVEKAKWLVENPDIRERIAQSGLRRVWADGHDVTSRARGFVAALENDRMLSGSTKN